MAIKFKEIKKYISRVVKVSICLDDGYYYDYSLMSDIPEGKYDELFVFGIGMVDVEFPLDVYSEPIEPKRVISKKDGYFIGCGLEIVLQEEARAIKRSNIKELTFGDLRNYLQCGENFSIVRKENWTEENYVWRKDIPEKYNNMYVYGIGIEDDLSGIKRIVHSGFVDSMLGKKMRIVVSESPRD